MSSTIQDCRYDPAGRSTFQPINPLTPLQSGDLNISYLVQEIAKKEFGYTGTQKYSLTLRNHEMILEIWDRPDGTATHILGTLSFQNKQWTRTDGSGGNVTVLKDTDQISRRLSHTLDRIAKAYNRANPGSIPSPTSIGSIPSAIVDGTPSTNTAPIINNYVTCDHSALNETLRSFQQMLEQSLRDLDRRLANLERPLQREEPRLGTNINSTEQFHTLLHPIHENITHLQHAFETFKNENHDLQDLKETLNRMSQNILQALDTISQSIAQLKIALDQVQRQPGNTQTLQEMQSLMQAMQELLEHTKQQIQAKEQENQNLQTAVEAGKKINLLNENRIKELELKLKTAEEAGKQAATKIEQLTGAYENLLTNHNQQKAFYHTLDEKQKELLEENQQLTDESEKLKAAAQEARSLKEENLSLKKQQHLHQATIQTLEEKNTNLEEEKAKLQQEIQQLKLQLETARKTEVASQKTIRELQTDLSQKNKDLAHQERLTAKAEEAKEEAERKLRKLQNELEEMKSQLKEMETQLTKARKDRDDHLQEARQTREDYNNLRKISKDLENEQEKTIQELRHTLASLQAQSIDSSTLQQRELEIERLTEENKNKEISEAFYKKQNAKFQRRINDLEKELDALRSLLAVKEKMLEQHTKKPIIKVSPPSSLSKETSPKTTNPSPSLPSNNTTEVVEKLLVALEKLNQEGQKEQSYPKIRLASILVNYALLDNVPSDQVDGWLEKQKAQFPDIKLSEHSKLIANQLKLKPGKASEISSDVNKVTGSISNAQLKFKNILDRIQAASNNQTFSVQACFSLQSTYIAKELLRYEATIEPLLKKYDSFKGKEESLHVNEKQKTSQNVEEARKLLSFVRSFKAALLKTLREKTWVPEKA